MYRYLIPAVIDYIKENTGIRDHEIGSTIDGRPNPVAPTLYISVWPTGRNQEYHEQYQVQYPFTITISVRRNAKSMDRIMGEIYYGYQDDPGLDFYVDRVVALTHGGTNPHVWNIINNANTQLQDHQPDINGFDQPFKLLNERVMRVDGTWWSGESNEMAGLASHLTYGGISRIAAADSIL